MSKRGDRDNLSRRRSRKRPPNGFRLPLVASQPGPQVVLATRDTTDGAWLGRGLRQEMSRFVIGQECDSTVAREGQFVAITRFVKSLDGPSMAAQGRPKQPEDRPRARTRDNRWSHEATGQYDQWYPDMLTTAVRRLSSQLWVTQNLEGILALSLRER